MNNYNPLKNINKKLTFTKLHLVLFSLTLVLISGLLSGFLLPSEARATESAAIYLSPSSGSFMVGNVFLVEVKTDTADAFMNAAEAVIYFPTEKLEVLSISKNDSVFSLWPQEPIFSNLTGEISFSGGLPHPGCRGIENLITIEFKTKEQGTGNILFNEAQVLASDGEGTNILSCLKSAKFLILESEQNTSIFSLSHPEQDEWYNNDEPDFQWDLGSEISGVSFILDKNSDTIPDTISEGKIQFKNYEKVSDGIWYFHLRLENRGIWGETVHYKIQVDKEPPHRFEIVVDNAGNPANPESNLYFETNDDTSGIDYYKLKIGDENFVDLMLAQINPFSLPYHSPGSYSVIARAVDKAGNNIEAAAIIDVDMIESPNITFCPQVYVSGEEFFYIEGQAIPGAEIIIFLKKDGKDIKKWQTASNNQGEWSFSTKELIESGVYSLSALAKDSNGAKSDLSETCDINVLLSGLSFGFFMISFRQLVLFWILILFFGIIISCYIVLRSRRVKRIFEKETKEAEDKLRQCFDNLRKEIEAKIELMDSKPGFNRKEKKVCKELKRDLKIAEDSISKEIKDIKKQLKI